MSHLTGKTVAFLVTDGFEDSELTSPWEAVTSHGAQARLVSPAGDSVTGKNGHQQGVEIDSSVADAAEFDALVLPGGVVNADHLRMDAASCGFARNFFEQHKPVGVICHGAWTLIEANVVEGRTCETRARTGSTKKSSSTKAWCPAARPMTFPPSTTSSSKRSARASTRARRPEERLGEQRDGVRTVPDSDSHD
jgi:putative intracellular protease/amidase